MMRARHASSNTAVSSIRCASIGRRAPFTLPALFALAATVVLSGGSITLAAAPVEPQDWASLQRDYIAFTHIQDPLRAGARGDRAALARWPDDSPRALAAQKAALEGFKARLLRIPSSSLEPEDALSRTVMAQQVDLSLESMELDEARLPFQTGQGFFTLPDTQAQVTTLASEADAAAWLARMEGIPAYFATETQNLQRGVDTKFTQPVLVTRAAIASLQKAAALPADQSPLLLPFSTLPASMPAARRAELTARARQIVDTEIHPAQLRLIAFFRDRYLPHARTALGAATLPQGTRYYAFVVRRETTTRLTPEEIHQLGRNEVTRIRAEMQAVMAQTGFQGDVRAFAAKLKADPHQYPRRPRRLRRQGRRDRQANRLLAASILRTAPPSHLRRACEAGRVGEHLRWLPPRQPRERTGGNGRL